TAAVATGLALLALSAGAAWVFRDRAERQSRTEAEAAQAVGKANALHESAQKDQDNLALWSAAREASSAAWRSSADASAKLRESAQNQREAVEAGYNAAEGRKAAGEADRRLLAELERIRLNLADVSGGRLRNPETVDSQFIEAFRTYGVDVD